MSRNAIIKIVDAGYEACDTVLHLNGAFESLDTVIEVAVDAMLLNSSLVSSLIGSSSCVMVLLLDRHAEWLHGELVRMRQGLLSLSMLKLSMLSIEGCIGTNICRGRRHRRHGRIVRGRFRVANVLTSDESIGPLSGHEDVHLVSASATTDGREGLCIVWAVIVAVATAVSDLPFALRNLRLDSDQDDAHATADSHGTSGSALSTVRGQLASVCRLSMTLALPQELVSDALRVAALLALVDAHKIKAILTRPLIAKFYGRLKRREASLRGCSFTDDFVCRRSNIIIVVTVIVIVTIIFVGVGHVSFMVVGIDGQCLSRGVGEGREVGHGRAWYGKAGRVSVDGRWWCPKPRLWQHPVPPSCSVFLFKRKSLFPGSRDFFPLTEGTRRSNTRSFPTQSRLGAAPASHQEPTSYARGRIASMSYATQPSHSCKLLSATLKTKPGGRSAALKQSLSSTSGDVIGTRHGLCISTLAAISSLR
ncbi:hypothetical protein KCU64_g76, partial [Aureobasidium melanogenum]